MKEVVEIGLQIKRIADAVEKIANEGIPTWKKI